MARSDKQIELESTDENKYKMRRSFSWDRAFYTSDGFLNEEELSSMIEGGDDDDDDDVNQHLQKIEEVESLEAKLLDEIEASAQRSTGTANVSSSSVNSSSGKKDSQAKKIRAAPARSSLASSSTPVKTIQTTRSPPSSGASVGNKVKPAARKCTSSKTGKCAADSPSKPSVVISAKNKVAQVNTRVPRTSPSSPVSSGSSSSSSKFSINQRSKRGSSVPRRSSVKTEKPSEIDAKRNDEWKASKPAVRLIPKTQSSISMKVKPPPVISHPSSPSTVSNSCSSSTDQRVKPKGNKGPTVNQRSKSSLKNRPTGQTPDRNRKQLAASRQETRSQSSSKTRKHSAPKTVAAVNTGLKQTSQRTTTFKPSKKQSTAKERSSGGNSRGAENIILVSPEVMDIKGKLNALKMEINMQKKDRCKETKMGHNGNGKGGSSSFIQMKNQSKSK